MKYWLKNNWIQLVLVAAIVIMFIFIFQKRNNPNDLNEYILKQKADSIVLIRKERDSLQLIMDITQDSIVNHLDSLLHVAIDKQNKTLYELQKQREVIAIPNYGSDSLRQYFSNLRPIYHDVHTE